MFGSRFIDEVAAVAGILANDAFDMIYRKTSRKNLIKVDYYVN